MPITTQFDTANQFSWDTRVREYDDIELLLSSSLNMDNGTRIATTYEYPSNGTRSFISIEYGNGIILNKTVEPWDTQLVTDEDTLDAENWSTRSFMIGDYLESSTVVYDDETRIVTQYYSTGIKTIITSFNDGEVHNLASKFA